MDNFKQALDRWLTSEPEDNYTPWVEKVVDCIIEIDAGYDAEGSFLDSHKGDVVLSYLNKKGYKPADAAALIYKTFKK